MLGWITGDVQERDWSCVLLSLSPWPPALGGRLCCSPLLPARFALKNILCHLIPGLAVGGGGETSCSLAKGKKIILVIVKIILI